MTKKIEDGGVAYPLVFTIPANSHGPDGHIASVDQQHIHSGMSLRAYIATKAMAAIIGRPITDYPDGELPTRAETASDAVAYADALLAALAGEA